MVKETELFESPSSPTLENFVCGIGWRDKFIKEMLIHETNCWLAFWMLLAA